MKKKLLCSLLCVGMLVPSALAAESFSDVPAGSWYAEAVTVCADAGLMKGTGGGNFSPDGTLTLAETATIAARMLSERTGVAIPDKAQGETWYQPYVTYLASNGVAVDEPTRLATRAEFFQLLAAVTDQNDLTPINSITVLPDTADSDILAFYNAGILTGTDKYGTFSGERTLQRSEVAAMVARILEPSLRQSFVPLDTPQGESTTSGGVTSTKTACVDPADPNASLPAAAAAGSDTVGGSFLMTVNGHGVTLAELEEQINSIAYETDYFLYSNYGIRLDLDNSGDSLRTELLEMAKEEAVNYSLLKSKAREMGCEVSELSAALFTPCDSALRSCITEKDLLCAKHILVEDEQTAQAILDGLKAVPSMDQFNALLSVFGTDPGMTYNPDGYLFSSGEMVSEFEEGVRALEIGAYSEEPVKSQFGYHIIWRLDPISHPDLVGICQDWGLEVALQNWAEKAQVKTDDSAIAALDVAAIYQAFLLSLSSGN